MEDHRPALGENVAAEILLAHRTAARTDDQVGPGGGVERLSPVLDRVPHQRQRPHGRASRLTDGREHHAIGVVDLSRPRRALVRGRVEQFVAARDEGDDGRASHRQRSYAERCRDAQPRRREHVAGAQDDDASRDVVAAARDMVASGDRLGEPHPIALAMRALDHDHRIRAFGQRRAGRDVHAGALADRAGEDRARPRPSGERKPDRRRLGGGGEIRRAHRVAVHGRAIETRHVEWRRHVRREDTPCRTADVEPFLAIGRSSGVQHQTPRLLERDDQAERAHSAMGAVLFRHRGAFRMSVAAGPATCELSMIGQSCLSVPRP